MYNLKNVYVALSFDMEGIKLIVSENENGQFNLLWSQQIPNDNYYIKNYLLKPQNLKKALCDMLEYTEKNLDLKIEKILITFSEIVEYFEIKQFITDPFVFTNYKKMEDKINQALNNQNKILNLTNNSNILWWQIAEWINPKTKKNVNFESLKPNNFYQTKIHLYETNSKFVDDIKELINSLNIEVLNFSLCQLDYHYLTNDKTKEQIIVDIHKDVTHILYFSNQILLSKNIIDFGEKDIFKNMNELVNNQNFNFENFVQFISHDFKDNKKPINLICQTNDLFLNASYLNTDQLYKLIDKSIIKFINLLCEQIKKINISFNTKISKILITSKTTNIGKYLAKNNFLQFKNIKVQEIQRNFLLLEDKYFLAAICIMRQVKNDLKTNNKKQTCVASYYSSEYDKKFEKSLAALTLTNSITKIVQKIIK